MVNAQEWLDSNYPKENRSRIKEIYLNEPSLEGELDLKEFTYEHLKVCISFQIDETKLTLKNLSEYGEIIKCVEVQEWLDENYPKEGICVRREWDGKNHQDFGKKRSEITELSIVYSYKNLEGHLVLNDFSNLKEFVCSYNKLTNLDCSNCKQLEKVCCRSNQLTTLSLPANPTNLKKLYLENNNFPKQDLIDKYGSCSKCQQPNTSYEWCQPCREKEWRRLEGQELVEKFIQQHQEKDGWKDKKLQWIPYKEFVGIEQIGEGGFSKIYKAKCKEIKKYDNYVSEDLVLKSLNNSQNIILELLQEITNAKLLDSGYSGNVVKCAGISQNPITKNYIMVMEYMSEGNLRQYLQSKNSGLSFGDKLRSLRNIVYGLRNIHEQNLIHKDLHSGNILNSKLNKWNRIISYISDLGLSCLANSQKEEGKIFGVLPYVAPEVLQGQPYTRTSDIYSFGIVIYELLANAYPYPKIDNMGLALAVCNGLRPNIDKVPMPQEVKDFVKRCWNADPEKRPSAEELAETIDNWFDSHGKVKADTLFFQQYQDLKDECDLFSQRPYQIHLNATLTSKMIDTNEVIKLLENLPKTEKNSPQSTKIPKQIEEIETKIEELKIPLDSEVRKLVENFVQIRRETLKDEKNKATKDKVWELEGELENRGLETENIEKLIKWCERLVELEQQAEQIGYQTQTEIPPKK